MSKTVKSPRFWINTLEWLDRLNILNVPTRNTMHYTLPVNPTQLDDGDHLWNLGPPPSSEINIDYGLFFIEGIKSKAFIMILGHDLSMDELLKSNFSWFGSFK